MSPAQLKRAESVSETPKGPILVTGGAGYIGSHCVRLLEERGVETIVVDNLSEGHRVAVRGLLEEVDLADADGLRAVFRRHHPMAVMHFAAKCCVGESVKNPDLYQRENVDNTRNLLAAMREGGVRDIVFSSTCATYGEPIELPMTEDHPQRPINPYGQTKLLGEQMLVEHTRLHGMRHAALRYFNAAGASESGELGEDHTPETHLIPLVLQVALGQREHISIFGDDYQTRDGTCVRDYVHVEDLADAHLRALRQLQAGTEQLACNLGTGEGYSVQEVIDAARGVTGHPIPAVLDARRAGDPAALICGGARALELLGWTPERASIERILADAWRFHQAHPKGYGGA